jgi:glycosyltransferase involved in cell wall biosynthesis
MSARLAIICTHPIQYNVPVFRELACRDGLELRVFYGWRGATQSSYDQGFGRSIQWDIPLLEGYDHTFVENVATDPGTHHFHGIDLPDLKSQVLGWKPTSILVYGWSFKSHLRIMRDLKGRVPVLFRGDSTLLSESWGLRRTLRRRYLRWVYRHVDQAFYVGTHNREYFRRHGLHDDQLVFAPHAVDNTRFTSFDPHESIKLRESLGVQEDQPLIAFSGKLDAVKAPELLLKAFQQLGNSRGHLMYIGSGPLETQLKGVSGPNVHYLGFQNQSRMPVMYGAADLLALPSRSETWGLALNESMASGCAVLASDRVGAADDLIQPGINGWIVRAGDSAALGKCLQDVIQQGRARLKEMGRASKQLIQAWSIPEQASVISRVAKGLVR